MQYIDEVDCCSECGTELIEDVWGNGKLFCPECDGWFRDDQGDEDDD